MIQNWVEIDVGLFREIFESFLNHQGDTQDKIIELQSPAAIWYNSIDNVAGTRIFIGSGIDPMDYRKWNEPICKIYENFSEMFGDEVKADYKKLNLCMFGRAPYITTMGSCEETIKMFWETSFASRDEFSERNKNLANLDQLVMWYYRKGKKIYYDMRRIPRKDVEHLIRIRVMDLRDWKNEVALALANDGAFRDSFIKDDIKKSDMVVYEATGEEE